MKVKELKKFLDTVDEDLAVCIGPPWSEHIPEELYDAVHMEGTYNADMSPKMHRAEKVGQFIFIGWPGDYDGDSLIQDAKIISCVGDNEKEELIIDKKVQELMETPLGNVPMISREYIKFLSSRYGFCGEICVTGYYHYCQAVLKLRTNDDLYIITPEGEKWFEERKNNERQNKMV